MAQEQPIIRLEKVSKSFGPLVVLDEVDLAIRPGETTVVIGPSGSGKTVLIKHMISLIRPDKGRVWYRDQQVNRLPERQMAAIRKRFGFVFQGGALFDSMTVGENVCFPLVEHHVGTDRERRDKCEQVLALVGLAGLDHRMPEELSGGQKKRVALARAIVMDPEVILYDEPTTGLDPIRADLINELILRLQRTLGATGIVVTHDMASARKVGDRIVMLYKGHLIVDTTPDRIGEIDNEVVARFVQGRASDEELAELDNGDLLGAQPSPRPPDAPAPVPDRERKS